MSILRITVRTFQSEDHANLFLMAGQNVITSQKRDSGLKFNAKPSSEKSNHKYLGI